MKTTFELNFRVLLFCSSIVLAGCNKDEFYEKEYLENPFKPDVELTGGVEGGVVGSTVGGDVAGSTVGGSAGGVTGDTVGGSTGGDTSSTDGGVVGGSTVGSTDGGSTAGTTDGGSTGGSTVGSTDGGATVGGSTGGTTVGSTDGGSTDGGSTGGTTGQTTQWADESFNQVADSDKKLDIVWVVDNSGSMGDEQASLANNFDVFIRDFIYRGFDFRMGITTTDTSHPSMAGAAVPGSLESLTAIQANANEQAFISNFKNKIQVGTRGSGNEKGLAAMENFLNRYETSWMRQDAYLVMVFVSDEEDQSAKTKEEYLARYLQAKQAAGAGYVKAYSIVNTQPCQTGNGITCGYERYAYQANQTAGTVTDIKDNFAAVLQDMGQSIINLLDTFPLAHDPILASVEVRVNGVIQANGWTIENRQLKFNAGSVPAVGATVQVRYQY